ncbi:MAG TPA: 2'-5' RNA ligase family protein [Streptomyces sp.]|nr:2'-5' RNA ligase family protein [Streptomyces sp.]
MTADNDQDLGQDGQRMRDHWWWRPGWSVGRRFYTWHLTFEGQHDLHRLAGAYRSALAPLGPALTPVPDRWLHLTMQGVAFADEITRADVEAVVEAARPRLAAVPAFGLRLGPETVDPEAVLLPAHPGAPVKDVRNAVRAAIGDALGDVPERAEDFLPHVSVAYSAAEGPRTAVADALTGLDAPPAHVHVTAAQLIVIHRDRHMYEWEPHASVPLG